MEFENKLFGKLCILESNFLQVKWKHIFKETVRDISNDSLKPLSNQWCRIYCRFSSKHWNVKCINMVMYKNVSLLV